MLPKISIITPSFNQGKFIEMTINSILDQNYPSLEYIIIDGGSTDNTVDIIKKYEKHLKYWVSEPDRGQSHAINKGLKHCTGDIFNWINSDDYLEPNALFNVNEAWITSPQSAAWIGATKRLHSNGFLHYISYPNGLFIDHITLSIPSRCLYQPSCFFNLNFVKEIKGVREDLHYSMDLDLYMRISKKGPFTKGEGIWSTALAHPDAKTVKNVKQSNLEKKKLYQEYKLKDAADAAYERAHQIFKYRLPESLKISLLTQCNTKPNELKIPHSFYKRNIILIYSEDTDINDEFIQLIINTYKLFSQRFNNINFIVSHKKIKILEKIISLKNIFFDSNIEKYFLNTTAFILASTKSNFDLNKILKYGIPLIAKKELTNRFSLIDGESCFSSDNLFDTAFKAILLALDPSVWGNISAQSLLAYHKNTSNCRPRILFYFFKNVHIPIMTPILKKWRELYPDTEIAVGYMPYTPQIRAGFEPNELDQLKQLNLPMYEQPQQFTSDLTFIADSVYPWVQGCGKLVHVGHGLLSKGQYYTDTETARREQNADLVCVPGKHHQQVMRKIISKPVVATGMAKLDPLFDGTISRESVIAKYGLPADKKYILFAPTFNDELSAIPHLGEKIAEIIPDDNTFLLIKLHGSTKAEYKSMYRSLPSKDKRVIYADELDITPFLALADVMISDVSSAMFEFAALDKPVVLFDSPDWNKYANYHPEDVEFTWRDFALRVKNLEEMRSAVASSLEDPNERSDLRMKYCDNILANRQRGNAAERIVRAGYSILNQI